MYHHPFLADRLSDLPSLSLFQKERDIFSEAWMSSVKHDGPLSKVLQVGSG